MRCPVVGFGFQDSSGQIQLLSVPYDDSASFYGYCRASEASIEVTHTVLGFIALTASLCSANRDEAVKRTQRIGTLDSWATLIQYARVSLSALVLSVRLHMLACARLCQCDGRGKDAMTDRGGYDGIWGSGLKERQEKGVVPCSTEVTCHGNQGQAGVPHHRGIFIRVRILTIRAAQRRRLGKVEQAQTKR